MLKVFYSDNHERHAPAFEVFEGGVRSPYLETPERAQRILKELQQRDWAQVSAPRDFGLAPVLGVHDPDYVEFLAAAWEEWTAEGGAADQSALLPATFALRGFQHRPSSLLGRAGYYMMDLSAPIVEGTYQAACQAANCAVSAAAEIQAGERAAFALARPPGHHAGRSNCAGYCYFNNAAIAANWLSDQGRVAVLDIDYHAGNGTQDIFYRRGDVLSISIHADPAYEYPYYAGYEEERGEGEGEGFHRNFPLKAGSRDAKYLETLGQALRLIREYRPQSLVISAGMDIYAKDPLGRIKITTRGIGEIGRRISALELPTAIILEGGYNQDALGLNMVTFLEAFL